MGGVGVGFPLPKSIVIGRGILTVALESMFITCQLRSIISGIPQDEGRAVSKISKIISYPKTLILFRSRCFRSKFDSRNYCNEKRGTV